MFKKKAGSATAAAAKKTVAAAARKRSGGAARLQAAVPIASSPPEQHAAASVPSSPVLRPPVAAPSHNITMTKAPPPPPLRASDETLSKVVEVVCASTAPYADLDEVIAQPAKEEDLNKCGSAPTPITYRTFAASLVCPKKFYLLQNRQDLLPQTSIGVAVHLDDSASFNELARRWDRLQFGSKAILIADKDHEQAAVHTEEVIINYFENTYASLGEQAPSLTIHRPAFNAPFGGEHRHKAGAAHPLVLRARPAVLRYRPKDNQWVIIESQAVVDPLGTAQRAGQSLQRIHFSMLAFRYWITQPHIPIAVRKRFLNIDLGGVTEDSLQGHMLAESARVAAPIDLKRSGVLHIRQFFPGPATLLDCDPPRLVKFIQRLSLEDLLDVDRKYQVKNGPGSGAFDLSSLGHQPDEVVRVQAEIETAQKQAGRHAHARSARGLKQKDSDEHELFEHQQRLMEVLLKHHTLSLCKGATDPQQVSRWESFSNDTPDGAVRSTYAQQKHQAATEEVKSSKNSRRGKKKQKGATPVVDTPIIPIVPCFSENLGAHCSRDSCPFFVEGKCLPQKVDDPIRAQDNHLFAMPSTSVSRKVAWWTEGMRTVSDVLYQNQHGGLKLTTPQQRYVQAVSEGKIAINPTEINSFFDKIHYPLFIIDFEATQFALPPFQKEVAYQSIPFQFSLDVFQEDVLTETPTHYDFLHFGKGYSPNTDPRKACIEELMRIVKLEREKKKVVMESSGEMQRLREEEAAALAAEQAASGSKRRRTKKAAPKVTKYSPLDQPVNPYDGSFIAHFASFEKSCLEKLGQLEEVYKEDIKHFFFLDTMDLVKKGFVHPNANGSNSLKKILPAVCPDFTYGVFGAESSGQGGDAAAEEGSQDEQKGENALGIFRLWFHQEGGGTLDDVQRRMAQGISSTAASGSGGASSSVRTCLPLEVREKVWQTLRIQLLEYCSLDTKALYEIMREIWKEKEAAKHMPPEDKSGWVFTKPTPREVQL